MVQCPEVLRRDRMLITTEIVIISSQPYAVYYSSYRRTQVTAGKAVVAAGAQLGGDNRCADVPGGSISTAGQYVIALPTERRAHARSRARRHTDEKIRYFKPRPA